MGIVRDLYYARKMSAGLKLPAPTVALLIKRLRLAAAMGGGDITKTVSGTMVHITDALAKAALSVLVSIEPNQDLHGYANPWPAGGGVNKFGGAINTLFPLSLQSGTVIIVSADLGGASYGVMRTYDSSETFLQSVLIQTKFGSRNYGVLTLSSDISYIKVEGNTLTDIQVEIAPDASALPSPYSPYANICPISGLTGLSVYHAKYPTGKHLVLSASDFTQDSETRVKTSDFIAVQPGTDYVFAFDLVDTLSGVKYETYVEMYNADGDKLRHVGFSVTSGCRSGYFTAASNEVKVKVDIHSKTSSDTITTADIVSFAFDTQSTSYDPAGKNLFNRLNCVYGSYLNGGGKPTSGSIPSCYSCPIPVDSNKTYTFSGISSHVGNNNKRVCFYRANDSFISAQASAITDADVPYSVTFTPPANTAYCRLSLNTADTYVMLEEGATQTVYEPYNGNTYALDWTTPAGTVYGGTLDVVTGELTVDTVHFSFDGTENWSKSGTYNGSFYLNTGIPMKWLSDKNICSHAIVCNTFPSAYQFGTFGLDGANKVNINIWLMPSGSSKQDWLDYLAAQALAGTPVEMVCELATPLTYQLTPQEVQMLLGENYVWSSSGDTVSVTYYAEGNANTLQSLNILLGGRYSNPKTADDVSDKEALEIILGGNK